MMKKKMAAIVNAVGILLAGCSIPDNDGKGLLATDFESLGDFIKSEIPTGNVVINNVYLLRLENGTGWICDGAIGESSPPQCFGNRIDLVEIAVHTVDPAVIQPSYDFSYYFGGPVAVTIERDLENQPWHFVGFAGDGVEIAENSQHR